MRRSRISLDRIRQRDLDTVTSIDKKVFPNPWGRKLLMGDVDHSRPGVHLVLRRGRKVMGHGSVLYLDNDGHIGVMAVDPNEQGLGYASVILLGLIREARAAGCAAMTLEVRSTNHRAQAMYSRFGFAPVGIRPKYYEDPDGRVDAIIMWLHELASHDVEMRLVGIEDALAISRPATLGVAS